LREPQPLRGICLSSNTGRIDMDQFRYERLSVSGVVTPNPCMIACIILTSTADGNGDITLYDGSSASDPEIIDLKGWETESQVFCFPHPIQTERGLYVKFGSNVSGVFVQYRDV